MLRRHQDFEFFARLRQRSEAEFAFLRPSTFTARQRQPGQGCEEDLTTNRALRFHHRVRTKKLQGGAGHYNFNPQAADLGVIGMANPMGRDLFGGGLIQ